MPERDARLSHIKAIPARETVLVKRVLTIEDGPPEHSARQSHWTLMEENLIRWLREGMETYSYRRMYALALEIRDDCGQLDSLKAAALKVIAILEPIIENPIARASRLTRANIAFWKMMIALACVDPAGRRV